jgi:hypothetical protein
MVHYDVSEDPIEVRLTHEQKRSPVVEGAPHSRFRIAFGHPALVHTIDFEESLTVGDLLTELHSHFHERVGHGEKYELEKHMDLCGAAVRARTKRCGAAFDAHVEWNRGMKRVDMLGRECKFRGVYLDPSSISDHLTLRVVFGK